MNNTAFSIYDLFIFYEIASLSYPQGFDEFMEEITEKSTRLFGTRRLAVVLLCENGEKKEHYFGFKNKQNLEEMLMIKPENSFVYYLDGGRLGFMYFENAHKISLRDSKLYSIFSKRIEELLRVKYMEQKQFEGEKRRISEYQVLLDSVPVQVWCLKDERTYVIANQMHSLFVGVDKDRISGKDLREIWPEPKQAEMFINENKKVIQSKKFFLSEIWLNDALGNSRLLSVSRTPVLDEMGNFKFLVCSAFDITELRRQRVALQESEEKFKNIFLQSPLGIEIYDKNGRLLEVNRVCLDIFGIVNPDELKGFRLFEDPNLPEDQKAKLLDGEAVRYETEFDFDIIKSMKLYNTKKSGRMHIECSITPLKLNSEIYGYIVIVQDITERKGNEEKIRYLTFHDNVTGLYNRHYFEEELRRLDVERQLPLSVIIGDLNGLKLVNDTFGHFEGDELLKKIADILRRACRKEDIIARWGGDEFAILLPKTDKKTAEQICMRIEDFCREDEYRIPLSIALGCAAKENPGEDINKVLSKAENAMYRQKSMEGSEVRKRLLLALKKTLLENTDETEEHIARIKNLALKMAEKLGLSEEKLNYAGLLAEFHDIGKVAVPEDLFRKGGQPASDESILMQKHVDAGYRIAISFPELAGIAEAILHHHERWDGGGYPKGLKGEEIPLLARIISIVDSYDELIRGMSYENNADYTGALREIKRNSGIMFDPVLVDLFMSINDTSF
ncbi:sensor domain-containing diguanylate cyclase/phosphohydrolase [Thermoanaerobacterium sp. DL9XJH110]|uniref:sensor domain-containing diguanylate cyclase/phosphohydrolase n=1 Tax=Thermoanaerobacterium sp. DL9XJH110 TaxID=3386643 RepID=UPI003BB75D9F